MKTEPEKIDVLAVGVHPDDVELSCAGTLEMLRRSGKKTGILDLTKGEMGTRGNEEIRMKESMQAASVLGVEFRVQLDLPDAKFEINSESIEKIIRVIRASAPDIILCNAPHDRHPDHGKASELVRQAAFYSGLSKWKTFWKNKEQIPHRPVNLFYYIQDYFIQPHIVVDITQAIEVKMNAIRAYSSQFYNPLSREPETPISGKDFMEVVISKMRMMGRYIQKEFAEGFISPRPVGVKNLFELY